MPRYRLGHRVGLLRDDDTLVPSVIAAVEKVLELEFDFQPSTAG